MLVIITLHSVIQNGKNKTRKLYTKVCTEFDKWHKAYVDVHLYNICSVWYIKH